MRNVPFVAWMVGYALACTLNDFTSRGEALSPDERAIGELINLAIWGFVGWLLYERATVRSGKGKAA